MRCVATVTRTEASATRWSPICVARAASRRPRCTRWRSSAEAGAADSELAHGARAWVAQIAAPDGGIPVSLPGFEQYPHAPWFQPGPGSMLTLALAAAFHAAGVADDEWLGRATDWAWRSIDAAGQTGGYRLKFALAFLDAAPDEQRARAAIASLARPRRPLRDRAGRRRRGRGAATARPLASSR